MRPLGKGESLTLSVQALVQLWQEKNDPILYDPVAVTLVHTEKFCTMKDLALDVDDKGLTYISKQKEPNCRVATAIKSTGTRAVMSACTVSAQAAPVRCS